MAKGHQAYRDSWATFLVKNALPEGSWQLGQFFIDEDPSQHVYVQINLQSKQLLHCFANCIDKELTM